MRQPSPIRPLLAALAALAAASGARAGLPPDIFSSRITFSINVTEDWLPGPTLYDNTLVTYDAPTDADPPQKLDLLHYAARGVNWSGHSTDIYPAFGSATAQSDGNGGVGVTQTVFTQPDVPYQFSVFHLGARSMWTQTFTNSGTLSYDLSLHLAIPELKVGLIDVPANRSHVSATETSIAQAELSTVITRADGSIVHGGGFRFGMRMFEKQILLGPGVYSNFYQIEFLDQTLPWLPFFECNYQLQNHAADPRCWYQPVSGDVYLGHLDPGDTMAYVYTLTAEGTTAGSEQGFMAFLGDPFSVNAAGSGITPGATLAVPEPRPALLLAAGVALLALRRRRER